MRSLTASSHWIHKMVTCTSFHWLLTIKAAASWLFVYMVFHQGTYMYTIFVTLLTAFRIFLLTLEIETRSISLIRRFEAHHPVIAIAVQRVIVCLCQRRRSFHFVITTIDGTERVLRTSRIPVSPTVSPGHAVLQSTVRALSRSYSSLLSMTSAYPLRQLSSSPKHPTSGVIISQTYRNYHPANIIFQSSHPFGLGKPPHFQRLV